ALARYRDVARHPDEATVVGCDRDERLVPPVIDLGQVDEVLRAQVRGGREEATLAGALAEPPKALGQEGLVVRLDGTDPDRLAAREADGLLGGGGHRADANRSRALSWVACGY